MNAASLADERLEICAAAAPPFLVVQKADGDRMDADAVAVVGAIGQGKGFDDADATPAAVVTGAAEAVVAGDEVALFLRAGGVYCAGQSPTRFSPHFLGLNKPEVISSTVGNKRFHLTLGCRPYIHSPDTSAPHSVQG